MPFDAPETWHHQCPSEAKLGAQATEMVQAMMPGMLCIIGEPGAGGYGRMLGVLYGKDGHEIGQRLMNRGLAIESMNADWCR